MSVFLTGAGTAPIFQIDPVFANNHWKTIIEACNANMVPDTWAVGDSKPMTINGKDYLIDIIGKNHDVYSDGTGKAPLTFQLHNNYATVYPINADGRMDGGWTSCDMRTIYLPSILALMPENVRNGIREVNKLTSGTVDSLGVIQTTADKLFLLSEIEVHGSRQYSANGEGTQYAYYANGGSKVKGNGWDLRSPFGAYASNNFLRVNASGGSDYANPKWTVGTAFAFCF